MSLKLNGKKFRVPVINGIGYYHLFKPVERWMVPLLKSLLQITEGVFVDVGANLGQTLLRFRSVDSGREYIGFEPNIQCCAYVDELIQKNDFRNCSIFPFALGDKNGIALFYARHRIDVSATIVEDYKKFTREVKPKETMMYRGDDFFRRYGKSPGIIKIDTEGAELDIIKGMENTIERHRPFIIMEILPVYDLNDPRMKFRKNRQDKLLELLKNMNFILFRITEKKRLERIEDISVHSDILNTNYLCFYDKMLKKLEGKLPFRMV